MEKRRPAVSADIRLGFSTTTCSTRSYTPATLPSQTDRGCPASVSTPYKTTSRSTTTSTRIPTSSKPPPTSAATSTPAMTGMLTQAIPTAPSNTSPTLSYSDQIALGVGLGIGLPTIALTLLAWCLPRRRWDRGSKPPPVHPAPLLATTTTGLAGNPFTSHSNHQNRVAIPGPPAPSDETQYNTPGTASRETLSSWDATNMIEGDGYTTLS